MASLGTAAGVRGSSGFVDGYDGDYTVPYGDSGTYSRFFLIPKADRAERERGLRERELRERELPFDDFNQNVGNTVARRRVNHHPTVKPIELMRHLVRLVTPPGGLVLDPFVGSGTTALACSEEGFRCIGIDSEAEYLEIAVGRLGPTAIGMGLFPDEAA
jgi:site-specific DNA-methyltransferase (adenine-specific)